MTRIFISYSRTDELFARKLAGELSNLSADIWIDVEDIPVGMKWSSAIQTGLDTADALILIISPESMGSDNVEDEWQYFIDNGKPVIPILLRQAKIHFQLNRMQWIDFKNQPFDVAMIALYAELRRMGIHIDKPPQAANDEQPLSHGHAPPPQADVQSKSGGSNTFLYAAVAVIVILIVIVVAIALDFANGSNNDAQATINAQNTRLAELEELTQTFEEAQDILTETADAQRLIDQTETQNAINTEQAIPTATLTDVPDTATPTPSPTDPPVFTGPVDSNDWEPIERIIDGVTMVLVPSGNFTLGTTQEHYNQNLSVCIPKLGEASCHTQLDDEFNGTTITINQPYWIDRYEVSEQVFSNSSSTLPQVNVTAAQAQTHCESRGGSLPTEVEWEYAAKGPEGWRYPWGNSWDLSSVRANICDFTCANNWRESNYNDGYPENAPVTEIHGSESWVGAFNMAGNVWEWTSDQYSPGTTNTLRGGGWTWIQGEATSTSRSGGIAQQAAFYGFRCVRPYVAGDLDR